MLTAKRRATMLSMISSLSNSMGRILRFGVLILLLTTMAAVLPLPKEAQAIGGAFCSPGQGCNTDGACSKGYCFNWTCHCDSDPGYCANRCPDIGMQWPSPDACGPGISGVTRHMPTGHCRGAGARPRYGGGIISYCNECVPAPKPPTPTPTPPSIPPCTAPNGCSFTGASCTLATGSAQDADGSPVAVHIYEGATFRASGPANPAFNIPLPFATPVGPLKQTHTLSAYALDTPPSGGVAGPAIQIFADQFAECLPPVPTVVLNAPSPVAYMGSTTISWNVPTATSCTGVGGPPGWAISRPATGNYISPPLTADTTFSMYCTNDGGNGPTASAPVTVQSPSSPVITGLSQPDYCTTNDLGATVTWSAQTNNDYQLHVATDPGFASVIYDSKNPLAQSPAHWWERLLRWLGFGDEAQADVGGLHSIPVGQLTHDETYYVRVRVRDNPAAAWSPWSANDLSLPGVLTFFTTPVGEFPVPAFTWDPQGVFAGQPIQFTDQSTGSPTSWNWSFGDSSPADPSQNPTHTYSELRARTRSHSRSRTMPVAARRTPQTEC